MRNLLSYQAFLAHLEVSLATPAFDLLRSVEGKHHIAKARDPNDQVILLFLLGDVPRAEAGALTVESMKEVPHADSISRGAGHGDGLQLTGAGCAKMHPNVEPRRRP
jgi:hypothetical protein